MTDFKFLNDNIFTDLIPTQDEINYALIIGREAYLNGHPADYNPFLRQQTYEAFDQGWELEHSYEILRQARDNALNNEL
jgi:hypothetical protein